MHVYRAGMSTKLAEKTQELNTTLLKVIEKDSLIGQVLEQLESKPSILAPLLPFL
jgi:CTP:phosphocholine cytidylyltransferase-like protein